MGGAAFGTGLTHIFALQVLIKACCGQSTEIMLKRDVKVVHQRRNMTSTDIENHPCWVQFSGLRESKPMQEWSNGTEFSDCSDFSRILGKPYKV